LRICASSSCQCGGAGQWLCLQDCRGGRCVALTAYCGDTVAPSGCTQHGCPPQQRCVVPPNGCFPLTCQGCNNGNWGCDRPCGGGGTCLP
jgi:hypothetical protein